MRYGTGGQAEEERIWPFEKFYKNNFCIILPCGDGMGRVVQNIAVV